MTFGPANPPQRGISEYEHEVYESQQKQREEVDEWLDILIESRFNPTLGELVKELQTMYELTVEKKRKDAVNLWDGIILE